MPGFLRLRQVCLVTDALAAAERSLAEVLGLAVCFRSPTIERYGLENAVFAVNGSFIELLAPVQHDTSAGRFLARGIERGAYLLAFDCDDLGPYRGRASTARARIVQDTSVGIAQLLQIHPSDSGAAMIEIDRHEGGEDLLGAFEWGGPDWHQHNQTEVTRHLLGVRMEGADAVGVLNRWAEILGRPAVNGLLALDAGRLLADPSASRQGRARIGTIDLMVERVVPVLERAQALGWPVRRSAFQAFGVWFSLDTVEKQS